PSLSSPTYLSRPLHSPHRTLALNSSPTRRSSDLSWQTADSASTFPPPMRVLVTGGAGFIGANAAVTLAERHPDSVTAAFAPMNPDRKSTRLKSSHGSISYAVFCLKKKKKKTTN